MTRRELVSVISIELSMRVRVPVPAAKKAGNGESGASLDIGNACGLPLCGAGDTRQIALRGLRLHEKELQLT